jgi:mediator of RNA polymerase II transcription subunit 25
MAGPSGNQQQPGAGGPLRGAQGLMAGAAQRPPFDNIEAARQQNLAKIQHLRQTLEAAQQQELQYKSQLEVSQKADICSTWMFCYQLATAGKLY